MNEDNDELIRRYQARVLTHATLEKAAGPGRHQGGGTYLATSFRQRGDLPATASLRKMSDNVVRNLAEIGLSEPVSLRMLPGRWWKVHIDAAEAGEFQEYGAFYVTKFLSSERLSEIGFEVVDGPFSAWANPEVTRAILHENAGKYWDARISNRSLLPLDSNAEHYSSYDDAYSTEELQAALDGGKTIQVFSGPYGTKDTANYWLDVRWESPE